MAGDRKNAARHTALAAGVAGNIIWGFSYLFTRVAQQVAQPMVQLSIRFIVAFAILNMMLLTKRWRVRLKGKKVKPLLLLACAEPIYFFFESFGIYYSNSTFAGVALAVVPIIALAFSALILKEFPTKKQVLLSFIPIFGVVLVTLAGSTMGAIRPIGILLIMGACIFAAFFRVFNRGASVEFTAFERSYAVIGSCTLVFTVAAICTLHGDFTPYLDALRSGRFLIATAVLSIFSSVVANTLVNYSATRLPMSIFSNLGSLITVCAMFVGVIFLREPYNALSIFGSLMVLVGIWMIARVSQSESD